MPPTPDPDRRRRRAEAMSTAVLVTGIILVGLALCLAYLGAIG